jgi:hypothetical protein
MEGINMVAHNMSNMKLPPMRMIRQRYTIPPEIDVSAEVNRQWDRIKDNLSLPAGSSVAIGVGSRGITNLVEVVHAVVAKIRQKGYAPFITPAVGSHGGATAEGQIKVLTNLDITEANVAAPIRATMEVVAMGEVNGIPLFLDKWAHQAAGIILINRIKPHTDFSGPTESGLIKMMAIGLGNQIGAEHYHRLSVVRNMYEIISSAGKELLNRANFLFGVGLVENQEHQTTILRMILPEELEAMEIELLKVAREVMPKLPLAEIDLLIIDEMGKDISGAGIDPIVTGRYNCGYREEQQGPNISRIFVRDLTDASEGNAIGIGQADVTTQRLAHKIDAESTAINCLTSCCPQDGKIPLAFATDREAVAAALMTLRPYTLQDLSIVYIKNTLELTNLMVSQGCLPDLEGRPNLHIGSESLRLEFDSSDNLISPFKIKYES